MYTARRLSKYATRCNGRMYPIWVWERCGGVGAMPRVTRRPSAQDDGDDGVMQSTLPLATYGSTLEPTVVALKPSGPRITIEHNNGRNNGTAQTDQNRHGGISPSSNTHIPALPRRRPTASLSGGPTYIRFFVHPPGRSTRTHALATRNALPPTHGSI